MLLNLLLPSPMATWWIAGLILLVAILVPLWVHLWRRQSIRTIPWAAMAFIQEAIRITPKRWLWEKRLLLATRIGIILSLLAAVCFSDPKMQQYLHQLIFGSPTHPGADAPSTHRIVILDTSLSMSVTTGKLTHFERAKQQIQNQIIRTSQPGDGLTIILMGPTPRTLWSAPTQDVDQIIEKIRHIQPTHGTADVLQTARLILQILKHSPDTYERKEIYWFTDLQKTTWAPNSEEARQHLSELLSQLSHVHWFNLVQLSETPQYNLAVTNLQLNQPICLSGQELLFEAAINKYGEAPKPTATVAFQVSPPNPSRQQPIRWQTLEVRTLSLESTPSSNKQIPDGQPIRMYWTNHFQQPGVYLVRLQILEEDALSVDNHFQLVIHVRANLSVLIVDGSSKQTASRYVKRAIDNPNWRVRVSVITPWELSHQTVESKGSIERAECVYLCNVPRLADREIRRLENHLQRGGGIIFYLGDQIEMEHYNQDLYKRGSGIFPAEIMMKQQSHKLDHKQQYSFDPNQYQHPLVQPFRHRTDTGLLSARCWHYTRVRIESKSGANRVLDYLPLPSPNRQDKPPPVATPPASKDPAIVEASRHRGRVILVTTSANFSWNSWPLNNSFVPLNQEMLLYTIQGRFQGWSTSVFKPLEGYHTTAIEQWTVRLPDGTEVYIPDANMAFRFEQTERSGIYVVYPSSTQDNQLEQRWFFAVNLDMKLKPAESNLSLVSSSDLSNWYPEWSYTHSHTCYLPRWHLVEMPVDLAHLCLMLCFVLLLLELVQIFRNRLEKVKE